MVFLIIGTVLTLYLGDVKIKRNGEHIDAFINMELSQGDTIITGPGAKAEIMEKDSSVIVLNENTTFTILEEKTRSRFFLSWGSVWAKVKKLTAWGFHIESPVAVAGVRGTEFFVYFTEDSAEVGVIDGRVDVFDKKEGKHYLLDRMKLYKRSKRRVLIRRLKKVNKWAEWRRKDLDHALKLAEKGDLQATMIAEILSKRINLPHVHQRVRNLKSRLDAGIRGKLTRTIFRIRSLEAEALLGERKLKSIGVEMESLKQLIASHRFRAATSVATGLDSRIRTRLLSTQELEARARGIFLDLRLLLKETKGIVNPKERSGIKGEITKYIKKVSIIRHRLTTQRRELERYRNLLAKLKQGIKP